MQDKIRKTNYRPRLKRWKNKKISDFREEHLAGKLCEKEIDKNPLYQFKKSTFRYKDKNAIPRPTEWGGYKLIPVWLEFWQGRSHRLHDRIYYKKKNTKWETGRLSP